jgi:hypothetical protein
VYSTCLFCLQPLGKNESIESLPLGRRVAFDPRRGRLWILCGRCSRWNLTPFEERWEALEECERLFMATPVRFSTEHIGLARLPEGVKLVRVGAAKDREFAGWRYGYTMVQRNRRHHALMAGALAVGAVGTIATHGMAIPVRKPAAQPPRPRLRVPQPNAASRACPRRGSTKRVSEAIQDIETRGRPEAYASNVARVFGPFALGALETHIRLALEMHTHEKDERRALEGELAALMAAWREAEELAAVEDGLLIPAAVMDELERKKREAGR